MGVSLQVHPSPLNRIHSTRHVDHPISSPCPIMAQLSHCGVQNAPVLCAIPIPPLIHFVQQVRKKLPSTTQCFSSPRSTFQNPVQRSRARGPGPRASITPSFVLLLSTRGLPTPRKHAAFPGPLLLEFAHLSYSSRMLESNQVR